MAEENNTKNKKKKGIIIAILVPIMILVFVVASFFAIIDGIVNSIVGLIGELIDSLLNLLKNPGEFFEEVWEWINDTIADISNWWNENVDATGEFDPTKYENNRIDPITVIDLDTFTEMKTSLDAIISRNAAGLDDATLKKMLLAYYRGLFLDDTTILIELKPDDFELTQDQNETWTQAQDNIKHAMAELETAITGRQALKNKIENNKNKLNELFEDLNIKQQISPFTMVVGNQDEGMGESGKIYLETKGMVQIYSPINTDGNTSENDKILYYHPDTLKKIYEEHYIKMLEKGTKGATQYANSVKIYLGKCYTYTENGIKMYSQKTIETTERTWEYLNETTAANEPQNLGEWFANVFGTKEYEERERKLTPSTIYPVEEQILEFNNRVSEYSTPVEFMIYLLEITGSKDFVNAFIETAGNGNYIKINLYELINEEVEYSIEQKERITTISANRNNPYTAEVIKKKEGLTWDPSTWGGVFWTDVASDEYSEIVGEVVPWTVDNEHETYLAVTVNGNIKQGEKYLIQLYYNGVEAGQFETDRFDYNSSSFAALFYNRFLDTDTKNDTSKVVETRTVGKITEQYDIAISEIKTWYGKFTPENIVKKSIVIDNLQGTEHNNERVEIKNIQNAQEFNSSELFQEIAEADQQLQTINLSDKSFLWFSWVDSEVFNVKTMEEIRNTYETNKSDVYFWGYTEEECLNVQFNYVREFGTGSLDLSQYTFDRMGSYDTQRKKLTMYATYTELLSEGIEEGRVTSIEDYDLFLGLLSNQYGYYKLGEGYKPVSNAVNSGKLVEYDNIYGGKSKVGELLVNGSDMLFELIASSERTDGFENIMRYILYKYSENDYGITDWSFEIFKKDDMIEINSAA